MHDKEYGYILKHRYIIKRNSVPIGNISFRKINKIFIINWFSIYPEYRNLHYGYEVISHILSHYKIDCIIGETLKESSGFWHKCIRNFNGKRKNTYFSKNCTSSFVIPAKPITHDAILKLLAESY